MYTGKTEQPCWLCADPETETRVDLPPRAIPLMKHGEVVARRDVVGEVSIHFCQSDLGARPRPGPRDGSEPALAV